MYKKHMPLKLILLFAGIITSQMALSANRRLIQAQAGRQVAVAGLQLRATQAQAKEIETRLASMGTDAENPENAEEQSFLIRQWIKAKQKMNALKQTIMDNKGKIAAGIAVVGALGAGASAYADKERRKKRIEINNKLQEIADNELKAKAVERDKKIKLLLEQLEILRAEKLEIEQKIDLIRKQVKDDEEEGKPYNFDNYTKRGDLLEESRKITKKGEKIQDELLYNLRFKDFTRFPLY